MQKIKHTSPIHQLDKLLQSTEGLRSKTIMDKKTVKKKTGETENNSGISHHKMMDL